MNDNTDHDLLQELVRRSNVRDIDAALSCACPCHPHLGSDVHPAPQCRCQKTPQERKHDTEQILAELRDLFAPLHEHASTQQQRARERAEHWSLPGSEVTIEMYGGYAPFQVIGVVDTTAFYLRSRHEVYDLRIADEGDDPVLGRTIDSGDETALAGDDYTFPGDDIIDYIVTTIRSHVRRESCNHYGNDPYAWYCSGCGAKLERCGLPD